MSYPKLSELKKTRVLTEESLSLKTTLYIPGGFLDRPFCKALEHYLKAVNIFPELFFDHWKPTWRSLYSETNYEHLEKAEIIVIPLTMYEFIEGINDFSRVLHSIKKLLEQINSLKGKTLFFILDRTLSSGLTVPNLEFEAYLEYLSLLNSIELSQNRNDRFLISVSDLPSSNVAYQYSEWVSYGFPFCLSRQGLLARIIASSIAYRNGLGKKLIAIDYDETLSPGIIGEKISQEEISLDLGNPIDRFYYNFQIYTYLDFGHPQTI